MLTRSIVCAWALSLLLAASAAAQSAPVAAVDLDGYVRALDQISAALTSSGTPQEVKLAAALPTAWDVSVDGRHYRAESAWLASGLLADRAEGWDARRSRLLAQLVLARNQALSFHHADATKGQQVRQTLQQVLAAREFSGRNEELTRSFGEWLLDWYERMRPQWLRPSLSSTSVQLVAVLLLLVAALVGVVAFTRRRRTRMAIRREGGVPADEMRVASSVWTAKMIAAAADGDVRLTARFGYLAAVARLEEEGAWRPDDTRTPREYVRLLSPVDWRLRPFAALVSDFETAWYGSRPVDVQSLVARVSEFGCVPYPD